MKNKTQRKVMLLLAIVMLLGTITPVIGNAFPGSPVKRSIQIDLEGKSPVIGEWVAEPTGEIAADGTIKPIDTAKKQELTKTITNTAPVELYNFTREGKEYQYKIKQVKRAPGTYLFKSDKDILISFPISNPENKADKKVGFFAGPNAVDETFRIQPKLALVSKDSNNDITKEINKTNDLSEPLAGAVFEVEYTPTGREEMIALNNYMQYGGQAAEDKRTITSGTSGELVMGGLREGTYTIKEISTVAGYGKRTTVAKFQVITGKKDTASSADDFSLNWIDGETGVFDVPDAFIPGQSYSTVPGSKLINYRLPNTNDENTDINNDSASNKKTTEISGRVVAENQIAKTTVRKGDIIKYEVNFNIPDNINEYLVYGFLDKLSPALKFKDGTIPKFSYRTSNGSYLPIENSETIFGVTDQKNKNQIKIDLLNPKTHDVVKYDVIKMEVEAEVVDATQEIYNMAKFYYRDKFGNEGNITGDTPIDPTGKDDPNAIKTDPNPKGSSGDQITIEYIIPNEDGTIDFENGKKDPTIKVDIFDEEGNKVIEGTTGPINGLPDGKYKIVPITPGQDGNTTPPIVEIEIINGDVKETPTGPEGVENYTKISKGGDGGSIIKIGMRLSGTWTPSTGTLTVLPMLGLSAIILGVAFIVRRKERE